MNETLKKVLDYIKENPRPQLFFCEGMFDDGRVTVFDEDEITLLVSDGYDYYELLGLTDEEEEEVSKILNPLGIDC